MKSEMPDMPERYTIEKLDDGSFLLEIYGEKTEKSSYWDKEELLEDLSSLLGEKKEGPPERNKHEESASKMTDMEGEDE